MYGTSILFATYSPVDLFPFPLRLLNNRSQKKAPVITSELPPGPRKLPLIGNLHNLIGSLPHRILRDLSEKYGPLMHLQLGEVSTVVASSPEMAREIMKTHDVTFSTRPMNLASEIISYGGKDIICATYGEYWREIRKICMLELLSAKRVQSFQQVREEEYLELVQWIASHASTPINLSEKIFSKSFQTTARMAFGPKSNEHEEFISFSKEIIQLASGFDIWDFFPSCKPLQVIYGARPKLESLHKRLDRIVENIIKDHRDKSQRMTDSNEGDDHIDLVDVLLQYEQGGERDFTLSIENVKGVIMDIFGAGSDTSATTIDWAMSEMVRNPELLKRAQTEVRTVFDGKGRVDEAEFVRLKFLKMVVKETLRMHPPAPLLLPRECREHCKINGYDIPAKTKMFVNGWAINRDHRYWKDPLTFDPERFRDSTADFRGNSFEYIPFGAGRRICPGINFGLANVELALGLLLYHFDWELPDGMKNEDLDMTEFLGVTVKRKKDLCLIPKVYQVPDAF